MFFFVLSDILLYNYCVYIVCFEMTKKEYILRVLDKSLPYWQWAAFIKEKILSEIVTPEYIEETYQKCVKAVDITLQQQNQSNAQQLSQYLASLHEKEKVSQEADQRDIENLEKLLHTF